MKIANFLVAWKVLYCSYVVGLMVISCNCDEGAWLFHPVLVLLAPWLSLLSHSSDSFLCHVFL